MKYANLYKKEIKSLINLLGYEILSEDNNYLKEFNDKIRFNPYTQECETVLNCVTDKELVEQILNNLKTESLFEAFLHKKILKSKISKLVISDYYAYIENNGTRIILTEKLKKVLLEKFSINYLKDYNKFHREHKNMNLKSKPKSLQVEIIC